MKKLWRDMDKPLFIMTVLYSIFGLIMIFSASSVSAVLRYDVSPYYFFIRQGIFLLVAYVVGFAIVLQLWTSKYKYLAPVLTVGIILALVGLFVYGIISNGAQSWYNLGAFNLQPSEFAKSILIMFMAVFYGFYFTKTKPEPYTAFVPLGVGAIISILVAMQPDLGGAVIIAGIVFFTFLSVPFEKGSKSKIYKALGFGIILAGIALLFGGSSLLNSSQLSRLEFRNPCQRYTATTGYQVCNGFIAIHNGGLFGRGLGESTQKYLYLPEAHTDFIFPIIVEELGVFVGALVLIGYAYMLYRILKIAKEADNIRCSILAYGTFLMLLFHILINLLGVLALIPLTGVPLPFLSYGGSFTLNIITMLFVVQRVAIENKLNKRNRELKNI